MSGKKKTAVLVAERSGLWSDWIEPLRAQAEDIAVILQRIEETPSQLAVRVRERLVQIAQEGELVAAALIGGDQWDSATLTARSSMTCALAAQMSAAGNGRLFLDTAHSGRGRHAMQALAAVLEEQVGDGVDIVTAVGSTRRAA